MHSLRSFSRDDNNCYYYSRRRIRSPCLHCPDLRRCCAFYKNVLANKLKRGLPSGAKISVGVAMNDMRRSLQLKAPVISTGILRSECVVEWSGENSL